jgi:hypothetical protein
MARRHFCTETRSRELEKAWEGLLNSPLQMHRRTNLENYLQALKILRLIFFFPQLHKLYALRLFYVSVQQIQLFKNMSVLSCTLVLCSNCNVLRKRKLIREHQILRPAVLQQPPFPFNHFAVMVMPK